MKVSVLIPALLACAACAPAQVTALVKFDGTTSHPRLSPDGKTLAFEGCKPDFSCAIYLWPMEGGKAAVFAGNDGMDGFANSPTWSPDGQNIAFHRFYSHWSHGLFVRSVGNGTELSLGSVCPARASWSADGQSLAVGVYADADEPSDDDCKLMLISLEGGKVELGHGSESAFSPDGKWLAYADGAVLKLLRVTSQGQPIGSAATLATEPFGISEVCWVADGKILYKVWGDSHYWRKIAASPGAAPGPLLELPTELSDVQLLPDGDALATADERESGLWRIDLQSEERKIERVPDRDWADSGFSLSPDGKRTVFVSVRTGKAQLSIANADGSEARVLLASIPYMDDPGDSFPDAVAWSPDGKSIAFTIAARRGNADLRSWLYVIPAQGGAPRRLGAEGRALYSPAWAHDGQAIYAAQGDDEEDPPAEHHGIVRVGVGDGKVVQITAGKLDRWPRESPDGRFVYYFSVHGSLGRVTTTGGKADWAAPPGEWSDLEPVGRSLYALKLHRVAQGSPQYTPFCIDAESGAATPVTKDPLPFSPRQMNVSADGRYLYFVQHDDSVERAVRVLGFGK